MIFQHTWQKVLSGEKTQTRRLITKWESDWTHDENGNRVQIEPEPICEYEIGKTYAVQPGRGKPGLWFYPPTGETNVRLLEDCKANGMDVSIWGKAASGLYGYVPLGIRITSIRREDVRQISIADARAEGFDGPGEFLKVWCDMHDKTASWELDPQQLDYWIGTGSRRQLVGWDFVMELVNARPANRYDAWALTFEIAST